MVLGKLAKRWIFGISILIFLNYLIQRFMKNLNVVVKLWIFDFSGIIEAVIITILNLISFLLIRLSMGGIST